MLDPGLNIDDSHPISAHDRSGCRGRTSASQAVVKMLRKTGFDVFEAADGSSAIDLLRADGGKIDGMLLDMTIPGASSHQVVAEAANAKPNIRVILTSAYSQEALAGRRDEPAAGPQLYSQAVSIRGSLEHASDFFAFVAANCGCGGEFLASRTFTGVAASFRGFDSGLFLGSPAERIVFVVGSFGTIQQKWREPYTRLPYHGTFFVG